MTSTSEQATTAGRTTAGSPPAADTAGRAHVTTALRAAVDEAINRFAPGSATATVLQHAANLVVRAGAPGRTVVIKACGPDTDLATARRHASTSCWLLGQGIVTASPLTEPWLAASGHAVAVYEDLGTGRKATGAELGTLLRQLHACPVPTDLELPRLNPVHRLPQQLEQLPRGTLASCLPPGADPDSVRAQLLDRYQRDIAAWHTAADAHPHGVVHGDLGPSNSLLTARGPAVLDLESFSTGPQPWDLILQAWNAATGQAPAPDHYQQLAAAYGADPAHTDPVLREAMFAVLALNGATRLAVLSDIDPRWTPLAAARLHDVLSEQPLPWTWRVPHTLLAPLVQHHPTHRTGTPPAA